MCGNVERQVVYLYSAKFMCKPASAVGEILLGRDRGQAATLVPSTMGGAQSSDEIETITDQVQT